MTPTNSHLQHNNNRYQVTLSTKEQLYTFNFTHKSNPHDTYYLRPATDTKTLSIHQGHQN